MCNLSRNNNNENNISEPRVKAMCRGDSISLFVLIEKIEINLSIWLQNYKKNNKIKNRKVERKRINQCVRKLKIVEIRKNQDEMNKRKKLQN